MLSTSLRFGWGNTVPVILFGLLPLLSAASAVLEWQPLLPAPSAQPGPLATDASGQMFMLQGGRALAVAIRNRDLQSIGE